MKHAPHWLVRDSTITLLWVVFAVVLTITVAAETIADRHAFFTLDGMLGFNAWYGFGACVAMILVARLLGVALKRRDDYYNSDDR